jgi:glycosyltransferase involved in cell wall biosynthesis
MSQRLSIITPSYNQAAFVERTLKSVLDQDWPDLEYIVVDGGSADGSVEIIERYAERLAWWVSEPDAGQTDAINKGLRRATGDVIAYINSDDYYLPGAFKTAMTTLGATGARWIAGACRYVHSDSGVTKTVWEPRLPNSSRQWWMLGPWGVPQASTFWRRDLFDEFGLFREDMHYVFDTEFGLRLMYAGVEPGLTQQELAVRVLHDEAKSFDRRPFLEEQRQFVPLFRDALTRRERAALPVNRALLSLGAYRLTSAASRLYRRYLPQPEVVEDSRSRAD